MNKLPGTILFYGLSLCINNKTDVNKGNFGVAKVPFPQGSSKRISGKCVGGRWWVDSGGSIMLDHGYLDTEVRG